MNKKYLEYYRAERLPHIWCPGCGNGIILNSIFEAFRKVNIDKEKTVIVSGIGCSSRAPLYMNFDTLHTTHGRAIAFATGIKMSKPELNVVVITGDGDASAIGGNHLIHASRRNIDLTVICFNNFNYGMTNGQYSPTTLRGYYTTTSVYGFIERPFDLCKLTEGAGATYVARATTYHTKLITNYVEKGLKNKGFSFIDVITQCPTYFGRKNKFKTVASMVKWIKDNSVTKKQSEAMDEKELEGKFVIGEFVNKTLPEYTEEYDKLIESLKKESQKHAETKV